MMPPLKAEGLNKEFKMKSIKYFSMVIIAVVCGFWILINITTVSIPVGMVGVRTQDYAVLGKKGVVQETYSPGFHRDLGPIDSWKFFDATVQTLEMTRNPTRGSVGGRDDINIQTADGNTVDVEVTVKFRIMPDKAHLLYENTGVDGKYKKIVRNSTEEGCMGVFGEMKTEDFYNPQVRRQKTAQVKVQLVENLADNFVEVIDVLIRDIRFDERYERKIQDKKLAIQAVELNKSLAEAEKMSGKTQVIEAETIKEKKIIIQELNAKEKELLAENARQITKIMADAQKYATQKMADANLVQAQKQAEGALLIKTSEAQGEKLRNEAMQGVGGSTIVALEAARNLNLGDIVISTVDVDLLNIDEMATKLGAAPIKKEKKEKK